MKRLIAATIALSLLGSTAAMAGGYNGYGRGYGSGYHHHHHHDDTGALIALGVGLTALAIIASQPRHHDPYYGSGYYGPDYYGSGYYDRGYYGHGYYGRGYYSHGDEDRGYYRNGDDDDDD